MGTKERSRPEHLAGKLLQIRLALGLSQNGIINHLGIEDSAAQNTISSYELGKREPPLKILLEYARVANVYVDALINDDLNLPEKIPSSKKSEGILRASKKGKKKSSK